MRELTNMKMLEMTEKLCLVRNLCPILGVLSVIPCDCQPNRIGRFHQKSPTPCNGHSSAERSIEGQLCIGGDPASWSKSRRALRCLIFRGLLVRARGRYVGNVHGKTDLAGTLAFALMILRECRVGGPGIAGPRAEGEPVERFGEAFDRNYE